MKKSDIRVVGDVRLLPRKVAAAKVGVCERTLFQWCEDGIGPPTISLGRTVYCNEASLVDRLRSRERRA
jgi:hypothetical protein